MLNPNLAVLVVDDDDTMRLLIREILYGLDLKNVEETADSSAALDNLKRRKAELIFLDWNLPQTSGIEFLQIIRKDKELKDTAVIMVTGRSEKEEILEAIRAGANDYILKPFNATTFREKINKIFAQQPAEESESNNGGQV